MSEDSFFKKIILRLSAGRQKTPSQPARQVDPALVKLLQLLEHTREDEIPCDEVFELLDQYVALATRHEDAAGILPLVKEHLDRCSHCREEYEALVKIIEATSKSSA
jgi:hypothetical protein